MSDTEKKEKRKQKKNNTIFQKAFGKRKEKERTTTKN